MKVVLIPSNRTTRIASLIPFQGISQHAGKRTNTEIIRRKRSKYQAAAHGETVQVAGNVYRSHRHLLLSKVITGRIVDVPTATQFQVTTGVQ